MMSHEFRTPLSTIIMFVNVMIESIKETALLHYLEMIKISLNLLLSLVNDMVDLKLAKENRLEPLLRDFSPTEEFQFVTDLFKV